MDGPAKGQKQDRDEKTQEHYPSTERCSLAFNAMHLHPLFTLLCAK